MACAMGALAASSAAKRTPAGIRAARSMVDGLWRQCGRYIVMSGGWLDRRMLRAGGCRAQERAQEDAAHRRMQRGTPPVQEDAAHRRKPLRGDESPGTFVVVIRTYCSFISKLIC